MNGRLAIVIVLVLTGCIARPVYGTSTPDSSIIAEFPLVDHGPDHWALIPVHLSPKDTLWVVPDLASGSSSISPAIVKAFPEAFTSTADIDSVMGLGGMLRFPVVIADSLRIGNLTLRNVRLAIHDIERDVDVHRRAGEAPIAGLIGQDIFGGYDIEFNLPRGVMRLYRITRDSVQARRRVQQMHCVPILQGWPDGLAKVHVQVGGRTFTAWMDTGARYTLIDGYSASKMGVNRSDRKLVRIRQRLPGRSDTVTMSQLEDLAIRFGDETLRGVPVRVGEFREGIHVKTYPDVTMGLPHLRGRVLVVSRSLGEVCLGEFTGLRDRKETR